MKITIECNDNQALVMQEALDFYSRVLMGQFREIYRLFTYRVPLYELPDRNAISNKATEIRDMVYPELKGYDSWGIFNPKCPEDSKVAYDILQILERALYQARDDKEKSPMNRCEFEPMKAGNQDWIKVNIEK